MNQWFKFLSGRKPTNDGQWSKDLAVFPEIIFHDDATITIKNIRHATYRTTTDYDLDYYERTIKVDDIKRVWFMVEPFSLVAAHTLLSFELTDGTYLAISVEIRKRIGQEFSQLLVLFFLRRHELMYVIGDERDLIKLRTNHRQDNVYFYPVVATSTQVQTLFVEMLRRAQKLQREPEFYNPFTNTCLTNIVDHVNHIAPGHIKFSYKIPIATLADRLAYELGLLDKTSDFKSLKRQWHINERALKHADDPDFSNKIRAFD